MAQRHHLMISRWLAAAVFIFLNLAQTFSVSAEITDPWQESRALLDGIRARHGIELSFEGLSPFERQGIIFEEIAIRDRKRLAVFLKVFDQELAKYPSGFFTASTLTRVVFTKKLFFEGQPAQGVFRSLDGLMYFDIYRDFGNKQAQRHSIHHEFFHMVDTSLGSRIDRSAWAALNDPAFKYEREGRWHKERNELNYFAPPKAGFATDYAFFSVAEDMAETFACLFIEPEHELVHEWAAKDAILAAKIEKMKALLQEFSSHIDSRFWENLFK